MWAWVNRGKFIRNIFIIWQKTFQLRHFRFSTKKGTTCVTIWANENTLRKLTECEPFEFTARKGKTISGPWMCVRKSEEFCIWCLFSEAFSTVFNFAATSEKKRSHNLVPSTATRLFENGENLISVTQLHPSYQATKVFLFLPFKARLFDDNGTLKLQRKLFLRLFSRWEFWESSSRSSVTQWLRRIFLHLRHEALPCTLHLACSRKKVQNSSPISRRMAAATRSI